jgi:2-keto-4-pentenoate hydratase/2-oxohepta-3-ene-1,7-dioic acid hydratase in catechol pathway
MRYATFSTADDPTPRLGAVFGEGMADVRRLIGERSSADVLTLQGLIQSGPDSWQRTAQRLHSASSDTASTRRYPLADVRWHAPLPRPLKNVICLGLNYKSHAIESATAFGRETKIPTVPVFFTKAPTTVSGPYDAIPWDQAVSAEVDYEAELGVIIGLGGKNIARAKALGHVFGYTVINDVSARDLQRRHLQWFKGKSLDGFCPMGPVVVTSDEFGDPQNKMLTLRVNGDRRQSANTADMLFAVDVIIEFLSKGMTIEAGDIIATGTPEGVGFGRTPPEFLKEGDVVETEIEGIGVMRNRVVLEKSA